VWVSSSILTVARFISSRMVCSMGLATHLEAWLVQLFAQCRWGTRVQASVFTAWHSPPGNPGMGTT
jgi:hypothetical protein